MSCVVAIVPHRCRFPASPFCVCIIACQVLTREAMTSTRFLKEKERLKAEEADRKFAAKAAKQQKGGRKPAAQPAADPDKPLVCEGYRLSSAGGSCLCACVCVFFVFSLCVLC